MYPYEFSILWSLKVWGDHPRSARDIAAMTVSPFPHGFERDSRSIAPTLRSLEQRGLLERHGQDGSRHYVWGLTDDARELVGA